MSYYAVPYVCGMDGTYKWKVVDSHDGSVRTVESGFDSHHQAKQRIHEILKGALRRHG